MINRNAAPAAHARMLRCKSRATALQPCYVLLQAPPSARGDQRTRRHSAWTPRRGRPHLCARVPVCGLKLASRRVGYQTSLRDAANETCPCRHYAKRRGCSKLPPRRRRDARRREWFESTITPSPRDSIVRDVPTPSTRRVPRAGVSASIPPVGVDASTGRARREEDDVVEDSVLSGLRRRTSQQSLRRDLQSARLPLRMQHRRRRSVCVDGAPPARRLDARRRHGALLFFSTRSWQ